jgi:hypothetical protein
MEVGMKRGITSPVISLLALLMVLSCTAHAQRSPSDDVRESHDPGRAAEVERKAEAISGNSVDSSGESGKAEESYAPAEERGEGESGGAQGGSESRDEVQPVPESSGDSGSNVPYEDTEENTNRRLPLDLGDPYY